MIRNIWQKLSPNPFEKILERSTQLGHTRFLLAWNRGLGEIPLGLFALIQRIRKAVPKAKITFITRPDLREAFALLSDIEVIVAPSWHQGEKKDLLSTLTQLHIDPKRFDVFLPDPDPTYWVSSQLSSFIPKLTWNPEWDCLADRFSLPDKQKWIGIHVQTESSYEQEKNWPIEKWSLLFDDLIDRYRVPILLFGKSSSPPFAKEGIVDLRGRTTLFEMLSLIKNRCSHLIAPNSGVLSLSYCLDVSFPLKIISLCAEESQGILKQNTLSPNEEIEHVAIVSKHKDIRQIPLEEVIEALFSFQSPLNR